MMKFKSASAWLAFEGLLDETVSQDWLEGALKDALDTAPDKMVRVDFSACRRANSTGLLAWIKANRAVGSTVVYVNTPQWFVEQFNSVGELLERDSRLESVLVNFICMETSEAKTKLLVVGRDLPILDDYHELNLDFTDERGHLFECEIELSYTFRFIERRADKWRLSCAS